MRQGLLNSMLVLQVLISLVLTGILLYSPWSTALPAERTTIRPGMTRPRAEPLGALRPGLIWAHLGDDQYVGWSRGDGPHTALWSELKRIALAVLLRPQEPEVVSAAELLGMAPHLLLGIDFDVPLPLDSWAAVWAAQIAAADAAEPGGSAFGALAADRLVFDLEAPGRLLLMGPELPFRAVQLTPPEQYRLAQLLDSQKAAIADEAALPQTFKPLVTMAQSVLVLNPLGRAFGAVVSPWAGLSDQWITTEPLIDPWVMVPTAPPFTGAPPALNLPLPPADLVSRFFPDATIVREVREPDATVFIDGQRALRLYPKGALEFWDLIDLPGAAGGPADFINALAAGQDFLSARLLWPADPVLAKVIVGSAEYRLIFRDERFGLPIYSREPQLEVRVKGNRVVYMYRGGQFDGSQPAALAPWLDAGQALAQLTAQVTDPGVRIRQFRPGYSRGRNTAPQGAEPVWAAGTSADEIILIDAATGLMRLP